VGEWSFDPVAATAALVAAALFARGFVRLRRRNRTLAPLSRLWLFTGGVTVGLLALVSPIDAIGEDRLLTAHMLQHLLLGDVVPLMVILALRGPMTVFFLPSSLLRAGARTPRVRALLSRLSRPRLAFVLWAAAIGGWHVPAVYDAALAHPLLHVAEHLSFVVAGFLVWVQILDPMRREKLSPGARCAFASLVLVAGMGLSEVMLASGPIYTAYLHVANRPFGWSAAEDQTRAGLLMMAEQLATLGSAAAVLLWAQVERAGEELEAIAAERERQGSNPQPSIDDVLGRGSRSGREAASA